MQKEPSADDLWSYVGKGNDLAMKKAIEGDPEGAMSDLDHIRDTALRLTKDPDAQNDIECRRLEMRMDVAGVTDDWILLGESLKDVGRSERFPNDRIHFLFAVAGGHIQSMFKRVTQ